MSTNDAVKMLSSSATLPARRATKQATANVNRMKDTSTIQDGLLIRGDGQMVVPNDPQLRTLFLKEAHDSISAGHYGVAKTLEKVSRQ